MIPEDDTTLSSLRPGDVRPELLAPAGDMDCARAAVANGADAIYFGLDRFNARLRANNFTLDSAGADAFSPCARGKRVRHDEHAHFHFRASGRPRLPGVSECRRADGVIVQDMGLARCLTEWSRRDPAMKLELHASTQMTLTSPEGLEFASRFLDLKQAVLARELSLKEIEQCARHTDIPLEVFVHGALCVAYSGQCLTSEKAWASAAPTGGNAPRRAVCPMP